MSGVFVSAIVSGALILLGSIRGNRVGERRRRDAEQEDEAQRTRLGHQWGRRDEDSPPAG